MYRGPHGTAQNRAETDRTHESVRPAELESDARATGYLQAARPCSEAVASCRGRARRIRSSRRRQHPPKSNSTLSDGGREREVRKIHPPTHRAAASYWERQWEPGEGGDLQLPAGRVAPPPEKRWAPVSGQQHRSIPAPRVNWHGPPPTPSHARRRRRRRRRWGGGRRREPSNLGGRGG